MGLRRRRRSVPGTKPVVLGLQAAAASANEQQHRLDHPGTSPLAGAGYDVAAGEYDLFQFVESPTDETVGAAVLRASALGGAALAEFRNDLTQDDLYTLLAFARRACVRALRGQVDALRAAWNAIGFVDEQRVDWRDAAMTVGLLAFCSCHLEAPLGEHVAAATAVAAPTMADHLRPYASAKPEGMTGGGYRIVATSAGLALADDDGGRFAPTLDLLAITESVVAVVEGFSYRVDGVSTGAAIPSIWLPAGARRAIDRARRRSRASVSVHARPLSEQSNGFSEQMLLMYVIECASPDDAALLAAAGSQAGVPGAAQLAVVHGGLAIVTIARSVQQGVSPVETPTTLERFRAPLEQIVASTGGV